MRSGIRIASICVLFLSIFNLGLAQIQPRTLQDIQVLLQEKASRNPTERKISSQLLQALRESRGQPMAKGVQLEAARVSAQNGVLTVDINADVSDALIAKIESAGGQIIYPSWEYHTIRAKINLSQVETIAGFADVKFVEPAAKSMTVGSGNPDKNKTLRATTDHAPPFYAKQNSTFQMRSARVREQLIRYLSNHENKPFIGSVTSQGDRTHRADDTRSTFGYSGEGIKIGVLSDSYNATGGALADVLSGDLPGTGNPLGNTTPVTVVADFASGADEGRAMLQIVHDLAPKAQLFFATADVSEASFASNITTLRNSFNCDIIIDDVFYFDEPVFQDGIVAQAVNTVTAAGALYFSSAGNEGNVSKGTAGYFEGDFNDAGSPPFAGGAKSGTIHNFGTMGSPINGDIITTTGNAYTLNWADPTGASSNDYDLFLVNSKGMVKASSTNIQSGTQNPFEIISPPALVAGDRLIVFKTNASQSVAFSLNTLRGQLSINTIGQTHGHSSAQNAFSVAATPAATPFSGVTTPGPFPGAFSGSNQVESFTSDGPRRVFFNPNGTPITPGNFLFGTNGGTVRNKPDITAADGVVTTLPGSSGLNPFYGTSASAPHAGAIAALLKSANPSLTPAQIRTILTTTAVDIESAGYDNVSGNGIVQAFQAMQAVNPTPIASLNLGTVTTSEGAFSNGNGHIDPVETALMVIQLSNPSMVNATAVGAKLTTSTPGILITQDTANYGTIAGSSNKDNSGTPYRFGVSASVPCGTVINFILTVNFGGGMSPKIFAVNVIVGDQPATNITSILGNTPPTGTVFTSVAGNQTGRLTRTGVASSCAAPKSAPGLTTATGARRFDAYTFTNTNSAAQCVTVILNSTNGINIYSPSYNSAGFVPSNPNTNFLADAGSSGVSTSYSFNAPAGQAFTVVVHDINVLPASNSAYALDVSLSFCTNNTGCTQTNITTASVVGGVKGTPYTQSFTATGGSGERKFSISAGNLPTGITLSGNTISGTPTQSGSFPFTITATDAAGCQAGTHDYTLVISDATTYTFTGNGNWNVPANWTNNLMPPASLNPGDQIIIDPSPSGQCVLNISYTLSTGATITVKTPGKFVIQGNLTQQ